MHAHYIFGEKNNEHDACLPKRAPTLPPQRRSSRLREGKVSPNLDGGFPPSPPPRHNPSVRPAADDFSAKVTDHPSVRARRRIASEEGGCVDGPTNHNLAVLK